MGAPVVWADVEAAALVAVKSRWLLLLHVAAGLLTRDWSAWLRDFFVAFIAVVVHAYITRHSVAGAEDAAKARNVAKAKARGDQAAECEWVNAMIAALWPKLGVHIARVVRRKEAVLARALPGATFGNVSFGAKPPSISGIHVHTVHGGRGRGKRKGLQIALDLDFSSDLEIIVEIAGIPMVGIKNVSVKGELCIALRPMLDHPPFFGGAEVLFDNPPEVGIDFSALGNVAAVPGLYGKVKAAVDKALGSSLVLPNRLVIPLLPDQDLTRARCPAPLGVMRVSVERATGLLAKDIYALEENSSDPYCVVSVGTQSWRSKTVQKTLEPRWAETADFLIHSMKQWVNFDVWDDDSDDSFVGGLTDKAVGIATLGMLSGDDYLGGFHRQTVGEVLDGMGKEHSPKEGHFRPSSAKPDEPTKLVLDGGEGALFISPQWINLAPYRPQAPQGGGMSGGGPNNFLISVVVVCAELKRPHAFQPPFHVRVHHTAAADSGFAAQRSASKRTERTGDGRPKYESPGDVDRVLSDVTALTARGAPAEEIEQSAGVPAELTRAFRELPPVGDPSRAPKVAEWRDRLTTHRDADARRYRPQFNEVLYLLSLHEGAVVDVELVDAAGDVAGVTRRRREEWWPIASAAGAGGHNNRRSEPLAPRGGGDGAAADVGELTYDVELYVLQ